MLRCDQEVLRTVERDSMAAKLKFAAEKEEIRAHAASEQGKMREILSKNMQEMQVSVHSSIFWMRGVADRLKTKNGMAMRLSPPEFLCID